MTNEGAASAGPGAGGQPHAHAPQDARAAAQAHGLGGAAAPRHAAIVYNPTKVDARRLKALVAKIEAERGWGPSLWAATTIDDAGEGAARRLLATSPDVVIAAGGDGTVSAVAQALIGQEVPLGILPIGTTNLFARALGLQLAGRARALRNAFGDEVGVVDVGRVDATMATGESIHRGFLVMTGIGVDAQMVVNTSQRGKSTLGWSGYIAAILGSFVSNAQFGLSYTLDGAAAVPGPAHTIVVGNAGVLPAGIRMIPGARVDDGLLDVVVLRPRGVRGWSSAVGWFLRTNTASLPRRADARAAARGETLTASAAVAHGRGTAVSFAADAPQHFEIDGEYLGLVTAVDTRIEPGALRVRGVAATRSASEVPEVAALTASSLRADVE